MAKPLRTMSHSEGSPPVSQPIGNPPEPPSSISIQHRLLFWLGFGSGSPWNTIRSFPGAQIRGFPQLSDCQNPTIVSVLMNAHSVKDSAAEHLMSPEKEGVKTPSFLQQVYQCFSVAGLALASYFLISHFILQTVQVVGVSMAPTLSDSQKYLLNKWVYYFRSPKPCDVVVLRDPVDQSFAVKRVIATEGDRVLIRNGKVYVNGHKLDEPYLLPGTPTFPYLTRAEESVMLGKGEYFVLGDNRKNSADSRTYGPVPRRSILGLIVR